MLLYNEGGTQAQADEAEDILEVLTTAYPGYPWAVRVYDGGFFIRNLDFPANYGMNCKLKNAYSWSAMKREIILMAGEWLERANLRRGVNNGDEIKRLEGAPENVQPGRVLDDVDIVVNKTDDLRTEPRPQALTGNI